jgi:hypothetical protein
MVSKAKILKKMSCHFMFCPWQCHQRILIAQTGSGDISDKNNLADLMFGADMIPG